jgi:hypothetical protein
MLELLVFGVLSAVGIAWFYYDRSQHKQHVADLRRQYSAARFFKDGARCEIWRINGGTPQWADYTVVITSREMVFDTADSQKSLIIPMSRLRWFSKSRADETILHVDSEDNWFRIRLRTELETNRTLLDLLNTLAPKYTGSNECAAGRGWIVKQNSYGEWIEGVIYGVYLLPHDLLIIQSDKVEQVIRVSQIDHVALIQRSGKHAKPIFQFTAGNKTYGFTAAGADVFARKLASFAGCELEEN